MPYIDLSRSLALADCRGYDTIAVDDELLVSGQTAYNTVQDQQWVYYHINVNARQTMLIHVEQNPTPNQNCDVDVVRSRMLRERVAASH